MSRGMDVPLRAEKAAAAGDCEAGRGVLKFYGSGADPSIRRRGAAMREPLSWSFPLGRPFGITVRVHFLFPVVAVVLVLRQAFYQPYEGYVNPPGAWIDTLALCVLLFVAVLLHEFGHCFAARGVGGDAQDILMWPLGGLAYVDVPQTPRANFLTAGAGPAVNFVLCLLCAAGLLLVDSRPLQPVWNPLPSGFPFRLVDAGGGQWLVRLQSWSGEALNYSPYSGAVLLARFFWVNWFLFLLNTVLVGLPLDGGRLLQAGLWPHVGYRQATWYAVIAGFVVAIIIFLYALSQEQAMALVLALYIYMECKRQWLILETGGDDSVFGYDFSQGYTSLEREQGVEQAPPRRPRQSLWQRWKQRRAEQKAQREREAREADERRMDSLLEKISAHGMASLTDEERRFMKQFSDRYKNRK
jgi:Zn-dependent protease